MSRTIKGRKGPGYEYWSARPGNPNNPGKTAKRITHKMERGISKQKLHAELNKLSP